MSEKNKLPLKLDQLYPEYCKNIRETFRRPGQLRLIKYEDIQTTVAYHNQAYQMLGEESVDKFLSDMQDYVISYGIEENNFDATHEAVATLMLLSFKDDFFGSHKKVSSWTQQALAATIRIPFEEARTIYYHFESTFQKTIDQYIK